MHGKFFQRAFHILKGEQVVVDNSSCDIFDIIGIADIFLNEYAQDTCVRLQHP